MKKMVGFMCGVAATAMTFVMLNKNTRKKAEKLFNEMMNEVDKSIKDM